MNQASTGEPALPIVDRRIHFRSLIPRVVVLVLLGWLFVHWATEHAIHVNWFKARGDQSWYLGMAELVYHNRHDDTAPQMMPRNIMPLYPAYQSFFYDPSMSDDAYFEVAKRANITLAVALLGVLAVVFAWHLPPLASTNLTAVIAFGFFLFKAGYVQPELLYYALLFVTLLLLSYTLEEKRSGRMLVLAGASGVMAGLAHLTRAALLPALAVWLIAWIAGEVSRARVPIAAGDPIERAGTAGWRAIGAALVMSCFFLVLLPYVATSQRVFGSYFYNATTSRYLWYDNWSDAVRMARDAGAETQPLNLPADEMPSLRNYVAHHTLRQMAGRLKAGFKDMVDRAYSMFWILKYVLIYLALGAAVVVSNRRVWTAWLRQHTGLAVFVILYAIVTFCTTAFYNAISPTGTARFLLADVTPLLFAIGCLTSTPPFSRSSWPIAGTTVGVTHVNLLVTATLTFDIIFTLWNRLMTTYGGF